MNDTIIEVVAGAGSGALSKTIMAPLDRLKLVVQLRSELQAQPANNSYNGPITTFRKILQEEGFLALWRGNVPTILIQGGTSALNFCFMDMYKKIAEDLVGNDQRFVLSFTSAALGGATAMTIFYPLGLLRTKLALDMGKDNSSRSYPKGMRDVVGKSVRANGFRSLYQGYSVALFSVTVYRMIHLGGYDYIKSERLMLKQRTNNNNNINHRQLPFLERLCIAQVVSMAASTVHYPFDSIRRRLMMQSDTSQRKYDSAYDCYRQIVQKEGMRGFYNGLGTSYVRSIGASFLLLSYDFFKSAMKQ
jgi:solute carrier family 25 (adenine nucleotide translocator) protein 4/5/6/31